jgi:dihydrofolate reductase
MGRKAILYIAASLDGYIAAPGDDLSFLSMAGEGEEYGYEEFMKGIGTIVMGRKTWDWVMTQVPEWPHGDVETIVVTRTAREGSGNLHYYAGDPRTLVRELKAMAGKDIFINGGAEIVNELLKESLIDEFILFVFPVLLGNGVRLWQDGRPEGRLKMIDHRTWPGGVVKLHYRKSP